MSYYKQHRKIADDKAFNSAAMRAWTWRFLQYNANHFHGTRLNQLVAEVDIWQAIPVSQPLDGSAGDHVPTLTPVYHATMSEGATILRGAAIYITDWPGIETTFVSFRGGNGVGVEDRSSSEVLNGSEGRLVLPNAAAQDRAYFHRSPSRGGAGDFIESLWRNPQWLVPGGFGVFTAWTPILSATRELRIGLQQNQPEGQDIFLWGVYVWEEVEQT